MRQKSSIQKTGLMVYKKDCPQARQKEKLGSRAAPHFEQGLLFVVAPPAPSTDSGAAMWSSNEKLNVGSSKSPTETLGVA
jgi:hypothetical protein